MDSRKNASPAASPPAPPEPGMAQSPRRLCARFCGGGQGDVSRSSIVSPGWGDWGGAHMV